MSVRNYLFRVFLQCCTLALLCNQNLAQNKVVAEASLRVAVVDPSGAAIPKASVQITAADERKPISTQTANARGETAFNKLKPGLYNLRVTAKGFALHERAGVALAAGANQLEINLTIAEVQEELNVEQDKREANTDPRGNAFTNVLTAEMIAQLPDDPEEFETVIRQMAGPGAMFRVNGFRGGKLPPKNQIREIRFRMNPYAADNHESSFIGVDIYTKPGLDTWHGSFNGGFRDEALNARNALAPFRGPEQNRRFGLEFGGPIWKNHTSLFFSADGVNSYDAQTIVAALPTDNFPSGIFNDVVRRPWRTLNLAARAEHLLSPVNTMRAEYQRNAKRQDNLGVGNFDLAERGYSSDSTEHLFRFADSGSIGKKLFNELRFQTTWQEVGVNSLSNATTIQVLNAFTRGGAQINSNQRVREIEVADNLDLSFKKHLMRAGFQLEASNYRSDELRNTNGTFIFSSLAAFRAGRPTMYTQRFGAGQVDFNQTQLGWYWQDDWRALKSLTLSFGVRHEVQTNLADKNNFAPRFSLAWSPFKNGKTTLRAGAGVFYDWFGATTFEQALRVNGQQQRDLVVQQPCFPNPLACGTQITLPPSRIQIDPALQMPLTQQVSVGLDREFPHNVRLMSQYFYRRGVHQLRGRNINAPFAGLRPDPTSGNITQIESSANSTNHTLLFNLNFMRLGKFHAGASYVLSQTINESDGPLSLPADNFNLRAERGPALSDIRHRFFMHTNMRLLKRFSLTTIFMRNSAPPYNVTTGFDNNGDTIINDRPAGVRRNSARGAGQLELSNRLSWSFAFGKVPEATAGGPNVRVIRGDSDSGHMLGALSSMPGGENKRYRMEFFMQATNVLNRANLVGFSGVQTSPFFGQATAAMPGRRIETGLRFSF